MALRGPKRRDTDPASGGVRYETTDLAEWSSRTSKMEAAVVDDVLFSDLFRAHLPHGEALRCIEIGALPGRFLAYLHNTFGYRITGIDFADNDEVFHSTMSANGIAEYEFAKQNFFEFVAAEPFDVVVSFGFIEHFDDYPDVIRRHCELVATGGYLVMTVPNFRHVPYVYHRLFDKANLDIHNTATMKPSRVIPIVEAVGFQTVIAEYTGGLEFWREGERLSGVARILEKASRVAAGAIGGLLPESGLTSAYLVMIFRRITSA